MFLVGIHQRPQAVDGILIDVLGGILIFALHGGLDVALRKVIHLIGPVGPGLVQLIYILQHRRQRRVRLFQRTGYGTDVLIPSVQLGCSRPALLCGVFTPQLCPASSLAKEHSEFCVCLRFFIRHLHFIGKLLGIHSVHQRICKAALYIWELLVDFYIADLFAQVCGLCDLQLEHLFVIVYSKVNPIVSIFHRHDLDASLCQLSFNIGHGIQLSICCFRLFIVGLHLLACCGIHLEDCPLVLQNNDFQGIKAAGPFIDKRRYVQLRAVVGHQILHHVRHIFFRTVDILRKLIEILVGGKLRITADQIIVFVDGLIGLLAGILDCVQLLIVIHLGFDGLCLLGGLTDASQLRQQALADVDGAPILHIIDDLALQHLGIADG